MKKVFEVEEAYWRKQFSYEDQISSIPFSQASPKSLSDLETNKIDSYGDTLSPEVSQRITAIAQGSDMAMFMILLAGLQCLLYKYTNEENMILGVPTVRDEENESTLVNDLLMLKNQLSGEYTFRRLLAEMKTSIEQSEEHQDIPFSKMTQNLHIEYDANGLPIVHTLACLKNLHQYEYCHSVVPRMMFEFERQQEWIYLNILFDQQFYHPHFVEQIHHHINKILSIVLFQPELEVDKVEVLSEEERNKLLVDFNNTKALYPREKTIHQAFEEQVLLNPDAIAVVQGDQQLTYAELNRRANQVAHRLQNEGVTANTLVGICVERSIEMLVGLIGILKAGGAYVPIDPTYPQDRIVYMLEDTKIKILVTQSHLVERLPATERTICLDRKEDVHLENMHNPTHTGNGENLAYVIYTSGSTGTPKGVLVPHRGVIRLVVANDYVDISASDVFLQGSTISFDAATFELWGSLLNGAKLVLLPPQSPTLEEWIQVIQQQQVSILWLTSGLFNVMVENHLQGLRGVKQLLVGGDVVSIPHAKKVLELEQVRLINGYGPTENTTFTCCHPITMEDVERTSIPIGKPIQHTQVYVVSPAGQLAPIGVAGELYIGGDGLAQGYLNLPELSAEKFVQHPWSSGQKLYRTGDLVKWLPDGGIEYLGRLDHQVKIRGFRIEIGEVEAQLSKLHMIQEAVVIVREDNSGQKQLCAYYVSNESIPTSELRELLAKELPSYMIPTFFVSMDKLPLTPNGKIDRKALPEPEENLHIGTEYVAPRTEVEQILASIWQGVLGVEKVGIMDHFFELGGDSIKSIQISSRLHQAGYKLEMKDLFKYPTIAKLSPYVQATGRTIEQGEVTGEAQLTPIQHWFFEQEWEENHHFNQAMMLYREDGFNIVALKQVLQKLAEHHDVLRMVFRQTEQGYQALNRRIQGEKLYELEVLDFRNVTGVAEAIEAKANQIQSSLNLSEGPLLKLGLFQCEDGDHLLVVIHHLVIDVVSWRILIEDLSTGYEQAAKGEDIRLPQKTDSFLTWAEQLSSYAQSQAMVQEGAYWQKVTQIETQALPKDYLHQQALVGTSNSITVQWSREETEQLLKQVPRAYNTEVNDILLTALGLAIYRWSGLTQVKINLEGHGREEILPELDITRTVGWFTSQYPVLLEMAEGKNLGYQIKSVKEALRQIPNKGIGYGIWRYLTQQSFQSHSGFAPEISFNYLGQFDQDIQSKEVSSYSSGLDRSAKQARTYTLDVNGMIGEGELVLAISYSHLEYQRETMESFAQCLKESLQEVIAHCVSKRDTELTPSDVLLKGLAIAELEQVVAETKHIGELENLYSLTPMQKGMWFHSQMNPHSGAYFEQVTFAMQGSLDVEVFKKSFQSLIKRHAILRTNFYSGWKEEPQQIVFRMRDIPFYYEDVSEMQMEAYEDYIEQFMKKDRASGFNLEKDSLIRLSIFRTNEQEYQLTWSFHHILMDGWCLPILINEMLQTYFAYQQQQQPELDEVVSYSQYIEWLEQQNSQAAAEYWREYLAHLEGETHLPQKAAPTSHTTYVTKKQIRGLGKELTLQLNNLAKKYQVTVNSLIQTAWGILLQRYSGTQDVVFGSVVSGRPAEIRGIEQMVGLFINTIPVRISCQAGESVESVIRKVQEQALASQGFDYYPLYEIQAQTEQKQNLINHIMIFENYPVEEQIEKAEQLEQKSLEIMDVFAMEQTNYDLNFVVMPGEEFKINLEFNTEVYDPATMQRIQNQFIHLLEQIVDSPQRLVRELDLLLPEEQKEILGVFNSTSVEYQAKKTLHQLFEEQVVRIPEQVAVVFEGQTLTYRELNEKANQLACLLREEGVQADQLVGVMAERSLEMVIAIFAVLKAGGAYLPIDPAYPLERIRYMLDDSQCQYLITTSETSLTLANSIRLIELQSDSFSQYSIQNVDSTSTWHNLAYVIYTSGTTGNPKGVMIEHQSVVNSLSWRKQEYQLSERDNVLQLFSFSFDGFVTSLFTPLLSGASVYLLGEHEARDPLAIRQYISREGITHFISVPSLYAALLDVIEPELSQKLRMITLAGDRILPSLLEKSHRVLPHVELVNEYGPTENSVVTTFERNLGQGQLTIGQPIWNHQVFILDEQGKLLPTNVPGELCVAGAGIARGYLNQPQLTAEKFVENPFTPGTRMYRTGDLARFLPNGKIEYLGRIDHQVKIRGFRIELGEIESQMLKSKEIEEAVIVALDDETGQKYLCAYFVAQQKMNISEIREQLAQELPNHMIPAFFVQLEQLPLTPNGKIDRKVLPKPEGSNASGKEYVAPRTSTEEKLVQIWQEVLGVEQIGMKDHFFELGGHSLRATTLVSKIHKEMNIQVPLRVVFDLPTLEAMATEIEGMEQKQYLSIPVVEESKFYPVSSGQKRLYVLHQLEGAELTYNIPNVMLLEGKVDRHQFELAFRQLIARHETLRTSFEVVNGTPMQRIYQEHEIVFEIEEMKAQEEETEDIIRRFVRAFDLEKAPLLRVGLVQLETERHLLLLDMHHIISDGVSTDLLLQEFSGLYVGEDLPPLRIQYKDYAVWQQSEVQSKRIKNQEKYWLQTFSGTLPVLELPTDFVRPAVQSFAGNTFKFVIHPSITKKLKQLTTQTGTTLYMVLMAAYNTLLHRYSGQQDIIVGTPIAGRSHADLEPLIGMFINTLAIRNYPAGEKTFVEFLKEVKETTLQAYENQEYPFEELVEKLNISRDLSRNALFDTMFSLESAEKGEGETEGLQLKPYPMEHQVSKFDLSLDAFELEENILCHLEYSTSLYHVKTIERIAHHFIELLNKIGENPNQTLSEIEILRQEEKEEMLYGFNNTRREIVNQKSMEHQFEEQVERTPDAVALISGNQRITYLELNEKANRLARTLVAEGVQAESLVGIMADRSAEMIIGMLAILKAGGAYVPIDPEYPEERIQYMLEDSGMKVLLVQQRFLEKVGFEGKNFVFENEEIYHEESSNVGIINEPQHLAYVIYTSGTTGKPKGVLIERANLSSYVHGFVQEFKVHEQDRILQQASISFDTSVEEIYPALVTGATIVIVPKLDVLDPRKLAERIIDEQISIVSCSPLLLNELNQHLIEQEHVVRLFISGGDVLFKSHFSNLASSEVYNTYGPTEGTVCATYYKCTHQESQSIPIGKPVINKQVYILNNKNQLQPVGVPGELCVAGDGVARGYLNRPELTAEKFIENPFESGGRMYRTGDLARWLPDGNIEYLGRIDDQVKIRGFRIELGEIEAQLLKLEGIQEAVVVAREDAAGQKQLCAYVVADQVLTVSEWRERLSKSLPSYMIPAYFVQLEKLPLTPNGKVDRKALPAPEGSIQTGSAYVAPRTEVEQTLASIWQGVLGVAKVSIMDHFFELGGDSIKSIQISSRLYQAGYKLEMKDLFKYPTIAKLSPYVQAIGRTIEQGEVTGEAKLTPIQQWFFEQEWEENHHFNQAMMLYRREGFEIAILQQVLEKLTKHHDALRMVFRQTEEGYLSWNRGTQEEKLYELEVLDFREETECAEAIEAKATQIQSSIHLSEGPLLKLGLFQCQDGDHLLLVIHHLVVDAVSWRILIEDLSTGYEQALKGEDIRLPQKTDSFLTWAEQLSAYAQSQEVEQEGAYWQKITQIETQPLPKDHLHQQVLAGASESITVQWNREETEQLLKQVPRAYNTEVNDILLTALGMALHSWSGLSQVKINLEGHGREEILPELDITRTVGWFTSQYPVLLEIEEGKHLGYQIKSVKEALRQIPNKGIGYGIWRYLSRHAEGMEWGVEPEISFNYLGQFDQDIQAEEGSPYSTGATSSDKHLRSYALDLNGMVSEGELMLDISYSPLEYHRGTIEKLAQCLKESLQAIITHCITKEKTELTPSDVLLKGLTIEEVEQIVEQTKAIGEIENIYRLTPMQKGMLFHSQMDPQSGAYFDQLVFTMRGHLSVDLFRKSFHTLMQRHAVLRTNFYSSWREEPFQIVYRKKNSDFYFEDLCQMSEDESAKYTQHFIEEDKKKGFALEQDALMRLSILRVKEREYTFIWSSHHILMDGWCMPILTKELFEMYFAYQNQQEPNLEMIPSYSAYIEWLEKQDNQIAANYWKEYLANYEQQTLLPQRKQQKTTEGYVSEKVSFDLGKSLTERIDQVTKQYQVTMNTLIQAAWGVLLQKYNNADDVVFGSVVSGRPAEIPGIEKMIGLFINTIPVRIHGSAEEAFDDLMRRVQAQAIASQEYDYYPLYEIQAQTEQKQNLINHILVFENFPVEEEMEHQADQWSATDEEELDITDASAVEQTNYDFNVTVIPGNEIRIRIEYNSLVYDAQILNQIQNHFIHLLEQIANDPQISIKALAPVTDAEENQLIEVFNNTATDYPREQTLHQLFEEQVKRTPEAVAVSFGNEQLSYTELNARANQLAHRLQAEGVQTESLVGILVERSIETVVGILAILKAGGAYVPIDPSYPVERMEYILQDSGARWLLIQGTESVPFPFQGTILHLSAEESYSPNKENVYSSTAWNDLAYIIYTSGSTGQPKGTLITHRNVIRVVKQTNYIDIEQADRVLQLSSFAFDGSTFDLYGSLLNGARLVLIKKEALLHMESLAQIIEEENISLFFITTALFNALVDQDPSCLKGVKNILFGGEKVSVSHVRRALETVGKGKLIHVYGPTESTVFATAYPIHELHEHVETIPIGYPISQTEVYILDRHHQLQPIGVPGEICIAGDGLARGYLHQSELTAEKFIAHPFKEGEILYKTGDLAKWLPDGSIEYIDRMDHQVKIRGFRIELGEINHRISQINGMKESIVIAKQNEKGSTNLCAYYVATEEWEGSFLRQMLAKELPNYMIPSYFVQLEQMPLTPNGKIDRKALPEPEESMITRQEYVAPRTEEEKILTEIWKEVLGIQSIGVKDDFFDLGGHSLKMMQLVHLIRSHMNIEVPLNKLFELSTLEEMAQIVVKMKFETGEHQAVTKLNHEGPLNVFCFPPGLGYGVAFYEIAQHLDKHCVLYGLDFIDDAEDHEKMLTQYVDTIVGIQEQSPYVLMGYSLGGNLAFEVAKVMESRGLVVSDIFIIDAEKRNHLTEISPVQMEEQVQYLLEDVAENMIESVRKKIHAYMMYNNQLINTGVIQANIHALVADGVQIENPEESDVLLWRSSTVQQATEYEIRGEHDEVFESPYIEENARIIQRIVKKIIEKQSSLIDERVLSR